jgi:serine/threonine protein kinase/RNA polymerase subunit RPABC4/transcription elongation factor Spt4
MGAGVARACSNCGDELVPGDRFCASCGARVDRACSACGVMLVSGDRFCPDCGTPQDPTGPSSKPGNFASAWDAVVRVLRSSLAGEYRITRELGRGGQAAVFQADEIALNRVVAIKVLAPGSISGERQVELFRREAQTIANLKHPHIVTIYSVRQLEDLHLFVMQYIEGRSLSAIIVDRGPLPLTAVRAVAFQVGSALQYAHRRNVIHRDVKPANVLFDEEGNAILTDFGIAKDAAHTSTTVTGSLMGTAAYMSPEQCHQSPVTWASDQYSLGVLLYEMLTGKVPFEGSSFSVMQGHTDREPPSIRALRGDCPVELEWAVMRMLAKQPTDRWPSIPDALAALGAGPLTRDDPIRGELKRLARWASATESPLPSRLTLRVPERLEVGESMACEVYAINGTDPAPQRVTATWRVSDNKVAEFDATTAVLTGVAPGRTTISAEAAHGVTDAELEVVPAAVRDIVFTLAQPTLSVGETAQLAADVRDKRGGRLAQPVAWSVGDSTVANVSSDGVLTAVSPGTTSVIARCGDVTAERMLFVQEIGAAALTITGNTSPLALQATMVLGVNVFDARGRPMSARDVRWESGDRRVVSVDRYGVVRALGAGSTTITARSGEAKGSISVSVNAPVAASPRAAAPVVDLGMQLATASDDIVANAPSSGRGERDAVGATASEESAGADAHIGAAHAGGAAESMALVPYRNNSSQRVALFAVPVVLVVAALAWKLLSGGGGAAANDSDPAKFFAVETMEAVAGAGYGIDKVEASDDFASAPDDPKLSVSEGRLALASGVSSYGLARWRATTKDFAVHVDVKVEPGDVARQGGLVLSAANGARYFVQLAGPAQPAYGVALSQGTAFTPVVPLTADASVRAGNNQLDVIWVGGILKLYVNGVRLAESASLAAAPDGRIGVFVGKTGGVTFDNLMVANVTRR